MPINFKTRTRTTLEILTHPCTSSYDALDQYIVIIKKNVSNEMKSVKKIERTYIQCIPKI